MRADTEHRLPGLEPDNLLAFLALLGTLRALEVAEPEWRARARWDVNVPPTRPVLVLSRPVTVNAISEALAKGCDSLAQQYEFGEWKVPNMPAKDARDVLEGAVTQGPDGRGRADILAALMSNIASKDERVVPTPLCLLFGQGHQYFLTRLASIPRQSTAPPRGRGRPLVVPSASESLHAALFEPWKRVDASDSFRWDPAEDRRYALRFTNPSDDVSLTVHGANRLAAIGFPVLTVAPTTIRGRVRLSTIGVQQSRGEISVLWPIWTRPTSLSGIRALLTHPLLYEAPEHLDRQRLQSLSVVEVRRAKRISVGKFLNFTRAVPA